MRVGFARVDITPPIGTDLTGFIARDGPSTGVHDCLYVRAIVFQDGPDLASVVTADLVGLGANLIRRVRRGVAKRVGIPPEHQLYSATHTHGGPDTGAIPTMARPDLAYLRRLEQSLVEVVGLGFAALEPALLGYGESRSCMGQNRIFARDGEDGPYDPLVGVLRISTLTERPLASVVNYACHATAAGPIRLINADYPGRLAALLESAGCGPTLYVNGAGADVNPRVIEGRGLDQVERAGDALAADAVVAWQKAKPVEWSGVRGRLEEVRLPLGALPDPDEAEVLQAEGRKLTASASPGSAESRAVAITHLRFAEELARLHYGRLDETPVLTSEVQAIRIGPVDFVALPGEAFSSTGCAVRAMTQRPVIVAGWANDLVGYIPDESAYERGGYEIATAHRYYGLPAPFTIGARDSLLDGCRRLFDWLERDPNGK